MLEIDAVNHVGIRIRDKEASLDFYEGLGFALLADAGFAEGHPIIMKHPSGVVLNLLGPATVTDGANVLMDIEEKHPGITHVALTISSLAKARKFLADRGVEITGSFAFGQMSAISIRDPDRNVIELDAYDTQADQDGAAYRSHAR